jgi:hypothetical protein
MAVKIGESENAPSPVNALAGWARQGIDSFMAAQKILLDLMGQQNALVIGMVRERLSKAGVPAGDAIAKNADHAVRSLTDAGKILLDLAASETELVVEGVKEAVPLPATASALANLLRHRVMTLINLQTRLLESAAEQTHEAIASYREGKGLMATGASAAELARRGIESFVETEKKFLDLAADEVSMATHGEKNGDGHKPARARYKVLAELARESGEKYIQAQKKLLDLAVEQMESAGKSNGKHGESARDEARTSWRDLSEKNVRNFVTAQKSLIELVTKPPAKPRAKAAPAERKRKHAGVRTKSVVVDLEKRKSA